MRSNHLGDGGSLSKMQDLRHALEVEKQYLLNPQWVLRRRVNIVDSFGIKSSETSSWWTTGSKQGEKIL